MTAGAAANPEVKKEASSQVKVKHREEEANRQGLELVNVRTNCVYILERATHVARVL